MNWSRVRNWWADAPSFQSVETSGRDLGIGYAAIFTNWIVRIRQIVDLTNLLN
jgi:hypothetical protein